MFEISLAQWSLHNAHHDGQMTNLDFPVVARQEFDLGCVEYVNRFMWEHARDRNYLENLRTICQDNNVVSGLIMVDDEGPLGAANLEERKQVVLNHHRWVTAAWYLGCHSIRVNAQVNGNGSDEEKAQNAADGLQRLAEFAEPYGIAVIVENHGGLSSNGAWLARVMEICNTEWIGTLPDFGNFRIGNGQEYDRYQGVEELMPYAHAVSAKSKDFNAQGNEVHTDYFRMMEIVYAAGYHGWVGIEYEGEALSEYEGIRATKALLERVRDHLTQEHGDPQNR